MKDVLITGGAGQIGIELNRLDWGKEIRIHAPPRSELDIHDPESIAEIFQLYKFAAVINTAAYTAVDKAEEEVGAAFSANSLGPALLAEASAKASVPLIHLSTDYVFAGDKPAPYVEDDPVGPLGVYGASKLAGELAVRTGNRRSVVLRTAWVLSAHRTNFLKTMHRLSKTRSEIGVVSDQIGCPTAASDIAGAIRTILQAHLADGNAPVGTYHFVNAGDASWHELAEFIFSLISDDGRRTIARAITTAEYPTPVRRPANSRLSSDKIYRDFGVQPREWRDAIAQVVSELLESERHEGAGA